MAKKKTKKVAKRSTGRRPSNKSKNSKVRKLIRLAKSGKGKKKKITF
jgi:hypothetical protein